MASSIEELFPSPETQEQAFGALALAGVLIVLATLSHVCGGTVSRLAHMLLNAIAILLMFVSLFGTGLVVISLMFILSPLFRVHPQLWYLLSNSLWCPMWALCIAYCEIFGGTTMCYYGDDPIPGETLIALGNHLGDLDWVVMLSLAARMRSLAGVRFICKASLAKLPLLGWGMYLHHNVFIRSRPEGRDASTTESQRAQMVAADLADVNATVISLLDHANPMQPVWIGLFPEGTRIIPDQHKRALEFAQTHSLQQYRYLLQPRGKGLDAVLASARPRITHALDFTIAYEGFSAECEHNSRMSSIFDGVTRDLTVHVLIRRIALPDAEEDTTAWLRNVWADKERHLARWENDGSFEAERIDLPLPFRPLLAAFACYTSAVIVCASAAVSGGILAYHFMAQEG